MNHDQLNEALNQISDRHITEATQVKKHRPYWLGAVAAVLAVVILVTVLVSPSAKAYGLIASPEYPEMAPYPDSLTGIEYDEAAYEAWKESRQAQYNQPAGYADSLQSYFAQCIPTLLSSGSENVVCSPVNIYMALAMLAECTGGSSRQQILELLGAESIDTLRTQAGHVWNAHYCSDGTSTSLLANSLWLHDSYTYHNSTVQTLADSYYASVYQGALGSDKINKALQDWLNDNTDGFFKEQASQMELPEETVLALASTIYYRAKWTDEFSKSDTKEDTFHAPAGDITCVFMNQTLSFSPYYYGEDYSAVTLNLMDSGKMWLILPDEGYTPQDILESGYAIGMVLEPSNAKSTNINVNLSVPKFDVTANLELSQALQELGITDVFVNGDFSPILPEADVYLNRVDHAARVKIDEKGAEAAAYTVMITEGEAQLPEKDIDFVLDRPFLFVITSQDGLPLFAGVVNNP